MKKLIAAVAVAAAALTGCSTAAERVTEEHLTVKVVDGARCVMWRPNLSGSEGSQMECDFR